MDISQLISACKKQDRKAQKELYELYGPKMMAVCLRYTNDDDAARDLLHDGFIQVFTQIGSFSGRGSFEGWIKRVFVNLALNNFRRENNEKKMMESLSYYQMLDTDNYDDDFFEFTNISKEHLLRTIRELPPGYRAVLNLFVFEEMTHKEIGKTLGINEAASRSQYARAKAFLQKKLMPMLKKDFPLRKQNEK